MEKDVTRVEVTNVRSATIHFVQIGVLVYLLYLLSPLLMLLVMSILLATALAPVTARLSRYVRRGLAVTIVGGVAGLAFALSIGIILPELVTQLTALYHEFPALLRKAGENFPMLNNYINQQAATPEKVDAATVSPILGKLASFGGTALGGLSSLVLMYVFFVYFLLDGARIYEWCVVMFKPEEQKKVRRTAEGVTPVISAYIIGQIITSVLCAVYTFATLSLVGVPSAVVLAILAGIFDILPIIGFFLFAIPAAIFAATVSIKAMVIVVLAFGTYHLIEAYWISPAVYGNRMKVSGLVVLISLLIGAEIGGILGAILILPLVASYPVIEEVWLTEIVGRRVVNAHKKISETEKGSTP